MCFVDVLYMNGLSASGEAGMLWNVEAGVGRGVEFFLTFSPFSAGKKNFSRNSVAAEVFDGEGRGYFTSQVSLVISNSSKVWYFFWLLTSSSCA